MKLWAYCLLFAVTGVAGLCRADGAWLESDLFGGTFTDYSEGDAPSSEGTVNGGWTVAAGVDVAAEKKSSTEDGSCMRFEAPSDASGMVFTPTETGSRNVKSMTMSVTATPFSYLPSVPDDCRAALCVADPDDVATFYGRSASGWEALWAADGTVLQTSGWYTVGVRLARTAAERVRVEYRLKAGDDYVALTNAQGRSWLDAQNSAAGDMVTKVEYRGAGSVEYLSGGDQRRGLQLSMVPYREFAIDENVVKHTTGKWSVLDDTTGQVITRPEVSDDGEAYKIETGNKQDCAFFLPKKDTAAAEGTVEFAVCFEAANDDEQILDTDVALVRLIEQDQGDDSVYRFVCLANGAWVTNNTVAAELYADYTIAVTLDAAANTIDYRYCRGRGGEKTSFKPLASGTQDLSGNLEMIFGGNGSLYEIKAK